MKKIRLITGLISVFMPLLLLLAGSARGSGEVYYFSDATDQTIVAQNGTDARGLYNSNVQLTFQGPDATSVFFGGQIITRCNNIDQPVALTLKITQSDYQKTYPTPATLSIKAPPGCDAPKLGGTVLVAKDLTSSGAPAADKSANCDQGALSWAMCPIIDKVSQTIASLATDFLQPLLSVKPLTKDGSPGLYNAWQGIRNFADSLFILIFLAIIFANIFSIRIDQYTLRKMIPRLVAATILVQFSFAITSFIVDLGNISGFGIQSLLLNLFNTTSSPSDYGNIFENGAITVLVGGLIILNWPIVIPFLLALLLGLLAFMVILGLRFIVIAILVVISPLAFIAWVLPNTEHYYKAWYKLFTRLIIMFPIIMAILAIAGRANQILTVTGGVGNDQIVNSAAASGVVGNAAAGGVSLVLSLMRPIILIATILLILRTFRWAGTFLQMIENRTLGISGKVKSAYQQSQGHQDRLNKRAGRQRRLAERISGTRAVTSLQGSKNPVSRGVGTGLETAGILMASAGGRTPMTPVGRGRALSKSVDYYKGVLKTLPETGNVGNYFSLIDSAFGTDDEQAEARVKLLRDGRSLLPYAGQRDMALAAVGALADIELVSNNNLQKINRASSGDYITALNSVGRLTSKNPFLTQRFVFNDPAPYVVQDGGKNPTSHVLDGRKIGDLDVNKFIQRVYGKHVSAIKEYNPEVFENMATDKETSLGMSLALSGTTSETLFSKNNRNYMSEAGKRTNFIKALINNGEHYSSGTSLQISKGVLKQLVDQTDILPSLAKQYGGIPQSKIDADIAAGNYSDMAVAVELAIKNART